jgi:hypothetical protein
VHNGPCYIGSMTRRKALILNRFQINNLPQGERSRSRRLCLARKSYTSHVARPISRKREKRRAASLQTLEDRR